MSAKATVTKDGDSDHAGGHGEREVTASGHLLELESSKCLNRSHVMCEKRTGVQGTSVHLGNMVEVAINQCGQDEGRAGLGSIRRSDSDRLCLSFETSEWSCQTHTSHVKLEN